MNIKILLCAFCWLSAVLIGFSQTGPGGVGNEGNNSLWLIVEGNCYVDSGNTLATDGSSVQQWNDISGNSGNALQTNDSFKPILREDRANGLSALVFDGNNDRILSSGIGTANQATLFAVANNTTIVSGNDGIFQGSPSGSPFSNTGRMKSVGLWINASGQPWGRGVQTNNVARDIPQGVSLTLGQFNIHAQNFDGSNFSQFLNQSIVGMVSYNGTLRDWSEFGMGRQGTESLNGEMSEVIVYTISLNSAQRIIVDNYLSAKYDITLANNDVYDGDDNANGDYDHEVAGIGRVNASNLHVDAQGRGIVRISGPTDLQDNEFLMWGHDNGSLALDNTDVPQPIPTRLGRVWRVSEMDNSGTSVDVGSIDIRVDMSGLRGFNASYPPQLLVDTDNDGIFADETPITNAIPLGGNTYIFNGTAALMDNLRFTFASSNNPKVITNRKITYRVKGD